LLEGNDEERKESGAREIEREEEKRKGNFFFKNYFLVLFQKNLKYKSRSYK
jgi:hypothetical protein